MKLDEPNLPDAEQPARGGAAAVPTGRRSLIARIATGAAQRWPATLAFGLVVLLAGGFAFTVGLEREGFPPINTPISVVTGGYFVEDPQQVDADVVAPLEEQLRAVDGVIETSTQALPFSFVIVVEFDSEISSEEGTARLVDAGATVPAEAQVDYRPIGAATFVGEFDLLASVIGEPGTDPEVLQAAADDLLADLVADDAIAGGEVRDLVSEAVDPETGEQTERLSRFTRVALQDLGYRPAVAIGLVRDDASGLDVLELSDRVQRLLDEAALPSGLDVEITADFAIGVRSQLSSLTQNLATGLAAVALVSLLFIGWRASVMTAGFMLTVLVAALALLWAFGYTLNTITLFGLILTLGLLVDDAIVISEAIDANRDEPDVREDDEELGVIRTALRRVGSASLAGTLTTVVVFSPLLFVGGIIGEFVRPIPATVIMTLLASFLFSILFIPLAGRFFLLRGRAGNNPVVRAMRVMAQGAGRLAAYPSGNGVKGWSAGVGLAGLALVGIMVGGQLAAGLGFSIFPQGKDAIAITLNAEFPPGTTIEAAQDIADDLDDVVTGVLGDELVRSQYLRGNERVIEQFIDLTPIDARDTTAPQFVEQIEQGIADAGLDETGTRFVVGQQENGPPVEQFPFAAQIDVDAETADAGRALAADIASYLEGLAVDVGADTVTVVESILSTDGQVARIDGQRYVEVRGSLDDDSSLSSALNELQEVVEDRFGGELDQRGLPDDALGFDFGFESDNAEDFAALAVAGQVALVLMLVLLTLQFRSLAQSLLIFLAIPFSFLGVFTLLTITDNPLSFLVAVGFIALIGVAVNNTILLVEAANRARREGASAKDAIREAVERRFRPLVATTITTVVGLLPLALSDPFWESLGFTLIGGLISSTLLVVLAFPVFYLALEAIRTPVRNAGRKLLKRPAIA